MRRGVVLFVILLVDAGREGFLLGSPFSIEKWSKVDTNQLNFNLQYGSVTRNGEVFVIGEENLAGEAWTFSCN